MRRFTKLFFTLALLFVAGVVNAVEYEIDQKFTSVAELDGQAFAIVNEAEGKAVFGSGAQNLGYDLITTAVTGSGNSGYYFKLDASTVEGCYLLRLQTPAGEPYSVWGNPGYLNTGDPDGTHGGTAAAFDGCFILGIGDKQGQDLTNGAAWVIEFTEGQGFTLKSKALDGYFAGPKPAPTSADPIYWTFCTLKVKPETDPLAEQKADLTDAIAKGKLSNAFAYTEASFAALGKAVADGETALAAADATAESLTAAKTAIETAQAALALKAGFTNLTADMFLRYASVDEPGEGTAANCSYELLKASSLPYGDGNVGELNWADLTDYDKLYITVSGDIKPRLCLNRLVANGQQAETKEDSKMLDINPNNSFTWSTDAYLTVEDGIYVLDLKKIVADYTFARLHSIKKQGWGADVIVTGLYLYKEGASTDATIVDWVAGEQNYENAQDLDSVVIAIDAKTTMMCAKGTGSTTPKYYTSGSAVRTYGGNVITFKGEGITKIVITGVSGKVAELTASTGELTTEGIVTTWKGEANEIVLTNATTNQQHIAKVHVVYGGEEPDVEPVHIANTAETAYTVAKAVELIEAGDALDEKVFVKGIVSKVEKFDETDKYITYWISSDGSTEGQQFECYKGKGIDGADFAAIEDVEVGAEIIATGTLTKYQTTYELSAGNTLVTYKAPVKPVIAEGNYYLYNVAADGFVVGANNWGTRASISKIGGIEVEAVMTPEGKYELKTASLYAGKHIGFNGYVDNGDESNWTIAPVEGQEGVYTLTTNDGKVLFWDGGEATSTSVAAMPETAENAYWKFISVADRLATLANATAENPVEATFLINNPDFGRNTSKAAWQGDDFGIGGGNDVNNNAEKWGGNSQTFDIHQTIELPNGLYKLTWNGFYRYNNTTDNTNDVAAAAHADGSEVIYSYIHINNDSIALTSIADEAAVEAFGKMPFSQGEAAAAFGMGLYEQTAELTIEDGQLIIGIKKFEHPGCDWTVWDNFRLSYLGLPVSEDGAEKAVADGWVSVIANGNLAGDEVVNFFTKENGGDPIPAVIVPGAGKDNSRGIVINTPDAPSTDWDAQFFIKSDVAIPAGAKIHVEFDYMATQEAAFDTQSHTVPGDYIWWYCVGSETATPEWKHFSGEVEVSAGKPNSNGGIDGEFGKACDGSEGGKPFQTVAFNLSKVKTATSIHFDNIVFWVSFPEAELAEAPEGWHSVISNGNFAGDDVANFFTKENGGDPVPAVIVAGAGKDNSRGIVINTPDAPATDWDAQFFIQAKENIPAGYKIHVEFDYMATQEAAFDTQSHNVPGDYIWWYCVGSETATPEWKHFSGEVEVSAGKPNSNGGIDGEFGKACDGSEGGKPFQTVAFNLSKVKTATSIHFDNIIFWLSDVDVSVKDVKDVTAGSDAVYDLQGRRVATPAKGLYIVNGKKVMVK